jgi:iron complex transport system substrate-binding protein
MKRSHWLAVVVLLVFAAAATLRVRSHLAGRNRPVAGGGQATTRPVSIPAPRDYVAQPWVLPEEMDRGPRRIVSLAPSITEIVCGLGMIDRLVGRTQFCRHPPGVEQVTPVGALMDTNFEKIKSLAPDLVLTTSNSGPVITSLRELNLHPQAVPHDTLEEVFTAIERVGELCDRPRTAGALVASIRADIQSLQETAGALKVPRQKVLVVLGELPVPPKPVWVAGPGSFLDTLLRQAGHTNAATGVLTSSHGELPLEKLLVLDVDVILTFGPEPSESQWVDLYQSWARVGSLRAIRERRVRRVGGFEWLSAGPRIAIALHQFVTVLSEFR